MTVYGYLLVATLIGIPWFVRGDRLLDGEGNPTAKPVAWSWVCLVVAAFFFVEFLSKLGDPFHQRNPENYYVMWAFTGFGLLAFFAMRRAHVTILRAKVVEHTPPFPRREIPLAEIHEIRDDGFLLVLRSRDKRKIGLPKSARGRRGSSKRLGRVDRTCSKRTRPEKLPVQVVAARPAADIRLRPEAGEARGRPTNITRKE